MKRLFLLLVGLCLFTGCPDYSHQRPVPDYKNMKVLEGPEGDGESGGEYSGE